MNETTQAFIIKSIDLLHGMEVALLCIEQDPVDAGSVHSLFRSTHILKGTASIFGLYDIVSFAHVAERLLEQIARGRTPFDATLVNLFLGVVDHLRTLFSFVARNAAADADCQSHGQALVRHREAALDTSLQCQRLVPADSSAGDEGILGPPNAQSRLSHAFSKGRAS